MSGLDGHSMGTESTDTNGSERGADGIVEEAEGRVEKAVGAWMGNRDLEREGEIDRTASEVKRAAGSVMDKVKDGVQGLLGDEDATKG